MDKFIYKPCSGCGEMLDEAKGDVELMDGEKIYCLYCAATMPLSNNMLDSLRTPSCPYCGSAMSLHDGCYWCDSRKCTHGDDGAWKPNRE